jgi:hypothetical protein
VPSALVIQRRDNPPLARHEKAIMLPSGDHDGSDASIPPRIVTRLGAMPLDGTTMSSPFDPTKAIASAFGDQAGMLPSPRTRKCSVSGSITLILV